MSIQLIVKAGTYPNFVTDLGQLPMTIEIEQSTGRNSFIFLMFALFILLFFLGSMMFFIAAITGIILYFTRGFNWFFAPNTMTFDLKKVTVKEFNLFKKHTVWSLPYRSFEGVFLNQASETDANGNNVDYITIELQHSDPQKTLPLYAKQNKKASKEVTQRLKKYANIFNLPAFD